MTAREAEALVRAKYPDAVIAMTFFAGRGRARVESPSLPLARRALSGWKVEEDEAWRDAAVRVSCREGP